nr:uncharacterized protein LOC107429203 isoform X2 [Ziziphus jujuba var. spinosa]
MKKNSEKIIIIKVNLPKNVPIFSSQLKHWFFFLTASPPEAEHEHQARASDRRPSYTYRQLYFSLSRGLQFLKNTKLKMKTVSGSIISSRPISLSKATATLSMFVSTDTGASQAIGAYLRRTLASFKELKQLKKELKTARSDRKRKRHSSDIVDNGEMATVESPIQSVEGIEELKLNQGSAKERKKRKKHASDIVENGEMTTGQIPTQSVEATQELSQGSVPKRKKQKRHTSDIVNSGHMTTGENPNGKSTGRKIDCFISHPCQDL